MEVLEPKFLTKTVYVDGRSCPKSVWLAFNAPKKRPEPSGFDQFLIEQGRQVGELARTRYPDGVLVEGRGPPENDRMSRKLLDERLPLFEAGFIHPDKTSYSRADVLLPVGEEEWDIVEVKSTTDLEADSVHDLAFQRYCNSGAGLSIGKCFLLHVNSTYVRKGGIDLSDFFSLKDVTDDVKTLSSTIQSNVNALMEISRLETCPEFGKGEPFHPDKGGIHEDDAVWKEHPDADVQYLYRGGKKMRELLESGVFRMRDIPVTAKLTSIQRIQLAAHTTGQAQVDGSRIASFLEKLRYPLHFLDIETANPAIPPFDDLHPYQHIPFQYSLHIVDGPGEKPTHHGFLSLKQEDPRDSFAESLEERIGPEGHIVVYFEGFEKARLNEIASFLPGKAEWVTRINSRIVDLLEPFRNFAYYHPDQLGSASLKKVLPAVTGRDYKGLEIQDGGQASLAYLRAVFGIPRGEKPSPNEINGIHTALENYCGQDTEGMVWIVNRLAELSRGAQ